MLQQAGQKLNLIYTVLHFKSPYIFLNVYLVICVAYEIFFSISVHLSFKMDAF